MGRGEERRRGRKNLGENGGKEKEGGEGMGGGTGGGPGGEGGKIRGVAESLKKKDRDSRRTSRVT